MKKRLYSIILCFFAAVWCYAQANLTTGEDLFLYNKPGEAAAYFEETVAQDPGDIKTFLYLGMVYEQLGRIDEAIAVYRQVLDRAGELTANVANNLGNAYFRKGSVSEAEAMYTQALNADHAYAPAYLGRANSRIKRGMLREAVSDYEQYLLIEPRSSQRQSIERLMNYIKAEYAEAERKRLVAEELARVEAERRQRLLDEITASLQSAAGASQGLSSGAEELEGYAGEFELE
jgi:tetratricopeptide (TPR) repeat protein